MAWCARHSPGFGAVRVWCGRSCLREFGGLASAPSAHVHEMHPRPSIHTAEKRFVYHAVHMVFNGDFMEPWAEGEKRMSKLVFIGKNLDAAALRARFNACLATPENLERKLKSLRFAVGEEVASPPAVTVTAAVLTLVLALSLTHALSLGYRRSSAR